MLRESARVFQEVLHRCLDRAGFRRPLAGRNVHVIHFHSLRHTFACHWRRKGGALDELIPVLGHTKAMTEHDANVGGYHRPDHFALFKAPVARAIAQAAE
jgi:integrase